MIVEGPAFAPVLACLHAGSYARADRWDEAAMTALLGMPGCFASLYPPGSAPHGMALLRVVADEAEILTIAVLPEQRGQGVGAALLESALTEAARRGAARAFLEVSTGNAPASALYRRQGFGQIGRRKAYYQDGTDALVMERSLPPASPSLPASRRPADPSG